MARFSGLLRRTRPRPRSEPAPDTPPPVGGQLVSIAKTSVVAMREVISLIKDSSDAFPPLKSVAGGLNAVITMIETMRDNRDNIIRLRAHVHSLSETLDDLSKEESAIPLLLRYSLAELDDKLQRVLKELDAFCTEGNVLRFIRASKRRSCLVKIKEDLNDAASAFLVSSVSAIHVQVERVEAKVDRLTETVNGSRRIVMTSVVLFA